MRIQTFQFLVNSAHGNEIHQNTIHDKGVTRYKEDGVKTPKQIDTEINKFIKDKKVIDIKVNHYTKFRHNNAGDDEIIAVYTIIWDNVI